MARIPFHVVDFGSPPSGSVLVGGSDGSPGDSASGTSGLLVLPRAPASLPSGVPTGAVLYDEARRRFLVYDGVTWKQVGSGQGTTAKEAFRARLTGDIPLDVAGNTVVTFDTVDYQTSEFSYSSATGTLTITPSLPLPGLYFVDAICAVRMVGIGGASGRMAAGLRVVLDGVVVSEGKNSVAGVDFSETWNIRGGWLFETETAVTLKIEVSWTVVAGSYTHDAIIVGFDAGGLHTSSVFVWRLL